MTDLAMTEAGARALARFLHELRQDWQTPGIVHALGQARALAPAADVALAAIRAASTPTNRTPAVIPLDGEHWDTGRAPKPPRTLTRQERCSICGQDEFLCRELARLGAGDNHDGHDFAPSTARHGEWLDPTTGELKPVDPTPARNAWAEAQEALAAKESGTGDTDAATERKSA